MFSFVYFCRNWFKLAVKNVWWIALFLILGLLTYFLYFVLDDLFFGGAL